MEKLFRIYQWTNLYFMFDAPPEIQILNPNPHGLFLNDFTQSDISALNGPIFKIFFAWKIFQNSC